MAGWIRAWAGLAVAQSLVLALAACGGDAASPSVDVESVGAAPPGTQVTLEGSDLSDVAAIDVGSLRIPVDSASETQVTFTTPAAADGGSLSVESASGVVTHTALSFSVYLPMSVTALGADPGFVGTPLVVSGAHLAAVSGVTVGGMAATLVSETDSTVTVTLPAVAAGSLPVVLTSPFEVITAGTVDVLPSAAATGFHAVADGQTVTLSLQGIGLDLATGLTVGGTAATIARQAPGALVVTVPVGTTGAIVLQAPGQGAVAAGTLAASDVATLSLSLDLGQTFERSASDPALRLVANKPLMVRLAVTADRAGVTAGQMTLSARNAAGALGDVAMTGPATLPTSLDPADTANAFIAVVPAAWMASGLTVEAHGTVGGAPVSRSATPAVAARTHIEVVMVPLTVGALTAMAPDAEAIKDAMARIYPYAQDDIVVTSHAPMVVQGVTTMDDAGWESAITQLNELRDTEAPGKFFYGWVPAASSTSTDIGGLGYQNALSTAQWSNTTAIGVDSTSWGSSDDPFGNHPSAGIATLLHELGHNHSLGHAPCGNPSDVDAAYPYAGGTLSPTPLLYASPTSYADASPGKLGPPDEEGVAGVLMTDVMGYCNGSWFSDYNYAKVQAFAEARASLADPSATTTRAQDVVPSTVFSGRLTPNGVADLGAHFGTAHEGVSSGSTWVLRVGYSDANGETHQADLPFQPHWFSDEIRGAGSFRFGVPALGTVKSLQVLHDGASLGSARIF